MLLPDVVRLNAAKTPHRLALVSGDREVTYGQLHERANRLAHALLGLAEVGDRVAILAENIPEYVEAYFGVPTAGMALTMLNYRLHPQEWAWILGHSQSRVLLVDAKYLEAIEPYLADLTDLRHVVVIGPARPGLRDYEELLRAAASGPPRIDVDADSTAWLIYTSGTTGRPKGAMLSHRGLLAAAMASVIEYDAVPDERFLMAFPLCHIAGYAVTLNMIRGGAIYLARTYEPELWMSLVDKYRITASALAPTMVNFLLQDASIRRFDLTSLDKLAYGAAPMPLAVLEAAFERLGPILYTGFGMTETSGNLLAHPKSVHVRAVNGEAHLLAACGRPVCLAEATIVRPDLVDCAPGEVGELVMRGPQLLRGYHDDPAATEESFAGGWFHSGDLARRDEEGFVTIVDRQKDMIVSGGENVYSREVEDVLYAHAAVREAAVIGLADPVWGESVTAVVVLRDGIAGGDGLAADLVAHCRQRLAGYKKPRRVVFVDELPRTVSGKVLKRDLRAQLRQPSV